MKKKNIRWTEDLKNHFIEMYQSGNYEDITNEFGLNKSALWSTANYLGVKRSKCRNANYTKEEDEIIINGFNSGKTPEEIQKELPWRTVGSIETRARKRLGFDRSDHWTDAENELLRALYPTKKLDEIVDLFPGRSRNAIILHAGNIGLRAYMDHYGYTDDEYLFIKDNYKIMTDKELGKHLGRSVASVKNHRHITGCFRHERGGVNYYSNTDYLRANNTAWKLASANKCGYKCVVTGERFDAIHHTYSFNYIFHDIYEKMGLDEDFNVNEVSEEERIRFANEFYKEQDKHGPGLCLSKKIHTEFHSIYGFGNNTKEQFLEFLDNRYPESKELVMSIIN